MNIIKATTSDVEQIVPLFDSYRQFYQQPSSAESADFLHERLSNNESIIFLAFTDEQKAVGFTQLYPTFCSVEMIRTFTLYDLYVETEFRNQGIANALLDRANTEAQICGVGRIDLQTAQTNLSAQRLYRAFGYEHSDDYQNWSFYLTQHD